MCAHFLGRTSDASDNKSASQHPLIQKLKRIQRRMNRRMKFIVDKFNQGFDKVEDFFMEFVEKFVYNQRLLVITYLLIVALTLLGFKFISTGFIPDEDQGVLISTITLPDGASLSRTKDVATKFVEQVKELDGVDPQRITVFGGGRQVNQAFTIILLKDYADRKNNPITWIERKLKGKETDLSHTAILSRIR